MTKLHIKNMVCNRCKTAVEAQLKALDLHPVAIQLGEVTIAEDKPGSAKLEQLRATLLQLGFELLDDKKTQILEKIKTFIIGTIHYRENQDNQKFSTLLSQHLRHDYSYLSKLFSAVEGITIEQYVLLQKTEKVKELLLYDERSLSQIAFDLGYSSTAHLSAQFKKITGLTPTQFKKLGSQHRMPLDEIGKS